MNSQYRTSSLTWVSSGRGSSSRPSTLSGRVKTTFKYSFFPTEIYLLNRVTAKSNKLTRGTTVIVQHFRLYGELTSGGTKPMLDINFIWLGYIACLSHWGGGEYFTRLHYFYLPSLRRGWGWGISTLRVIVGKASLA
jgi:hypothetical protein